MLLQTIIITVLLSLSCVSYFLTKFFLFKKSCEPTSEKTLKELFLESNEKTHYLCLEKTCLYERLIVMFSKQKHPMFCDALLFRQKDYLLALSKFIDFKTKKSKQKFRAKRGKILIAEIAKLLARKTMQQKRCDVFSKFKLLSEQLKLRQKEIKIFPILLSYEIILNIIQLEGELSEISNVIFNSKNAKRVKKYRKMILFSANIYGILKFNKNSTKLLRPFSGSVKKEISCLMSELLEAEFHLKLSVSCVKVLFN